MSKLQTGLTDFLKTTINELRGVEIYNILRDSKLPAEVEHYLQLHPATESVRSLDRPPDYEHEQQAQA
ncbi:hypothetical protein [Pseudomonas sp. COR18]|uniref:hypothetical protein n=1 Tax=Pseudomonas sp. COR18 TaxID=3399680 RepID=UPI003AFFA4ED